MENQVDNHMENRMGTNDSGSTVVILGSDRNQLYSDETYPKPNYT